MAQTSLTLWLTNKKSYYNYIVSTRSSRVLTKKIKGGIDILGLIPFNRNSMQRRNNRSFLDFYDIIDDFFNDDFLLSRNLNRSTFKVDVKDNEQEHLIEADLPGVKKEEIKLDYRDGNMIILVKREENVDEKNEHYIHRERRTSSMQRNIYLQDIDVNGIHAKLEEGILRIKAPKLESKVNTTQLEIE